MERNLFYSKSKSNLSQRELENSNLSSSEVSKPNRGHEILIMNVDVGNGHKEPIVVHEADEPSDLSHDFAIKFGLSKKLESALTKQIE